MKQEVVVDQGRVVEKRTKDDELEKVRKECDDKEKAANGEDCDPEPQQQRSPQANGRR